MTKPRLANVRAVFVKEIRTLTRSPTFHVLGAAFAGLAGYFFYTDVVYFDLLNQDKVGLAHGLWERFFEDLRLCVMVLAPVLAARLFAEERRLGTLEMLLTYPLREGEVVAGKFLSLLAAFLPLLGVTLLFPLWLSTVWPVDPWPLVAAYAGTALLGAACLACGMLASALASHQSSAALGALGVLFFFWFLAWNEAAASPTVLAVTRRLSLFDRYYDFTRGTVQSRDVAYFLIVTLTLAWLSFEALRWRWRRRRAGHVLRILAVVALVVAMDEAAVRHNRTLDLVEDPEAVLAPESREVLASLEAPVTILFFYETGRHPEASYVAEKLAAASPRIVVRLVDFDRETALARKYGVGEFGGAVVESGERWKLVHPAEETLLVRAIVSVTEPGPRLVCASVGHGEKELRIERLDGGEGAGDVGELLESIGYGWQEVALGEEGVVPEDCRVLLVNGPEVDFAPAALEAVERHLRSGGGVVLLAEPGPLPRIEDWLRRHRVALGDEIESNGGGRLYLRDSRTLAVTEVSPSAEAPRRMSGVLWGARQVALVPGGGGGVRAAAAFLAYASPSRGQLPVGAAVEGATGGRLVVIGDSDFLSGALFRRDSNRALFVTVLRWAAERGGEAPRSRPRYAFAPLTWSRSRDLLLVSSLPAVLFLLGGGWAWRSGRAR